MVAKKMDIKALYTGKYTVQEGFNPNYIEVSGERVSMVRILAAVIDKFTSEDGNYGTITIDDGTDTIRVKAFQDLRLIENVEKGDIVEIIGKIREYNEERYIQPEIIVKIEDPNFEVIRKLELRKIKAAPPAPQEPAEVKIETAEEIKKLEVEQKAVDEQKAAEEAKGPVEEVKEKKPARAKKGPVEQKKLV